MIKTRNITITPIGDSQEETKYYWGILNELNNNVYKAANECISFLWADKTYRDVLRREGNTAKEASEILKLEYGKSTQATLYNIVKERYNNLHSVSSSITDCITNRVTKDFKNNLLEVMQGGRVLNTYKKGLPIGLRRISINNHTIEGFTAFKIPFKYVFGRDKSNHKSFIEKVLTGEYKLCDSSIQIKKGGGAELLLCVDVPDIENKLNKDLILGVDLGINTPAYCAVNIGFHRKAIGSNRELVKFRGQLQARRKQLQRDARFARGGQGRCKKLGVLDKLTLKERNFVKTYNHKVSKDIISNAIRFQCGVIQLENLSGIGKDKKNSWILRNWSYFELQTMIEYKAKMNGIEVRYIKPAYTSQTCSKCGHVDKENRLTQKDFVCLSCGYSANADYNAALNIARSKNY